MKWKKDKRDAWAGFDSWSVRYKSFKIRVEEGSTGFSRIVEYYYFVLNNEKTDVRNNSLWQEKRFESLEDAQKAAVDWVDNHLKTL